MSVISGREREARRIRRANRAAAVGRLMLGEFHSWYDFLQADVIDLENLPRRNLKSGQADVKQRLSPELIGSCARNFQGLTEQKLSALYEEIKAFRGIELELSDFERRFAPIKRDVLKGRPPHLTVSISLWGLQFRFPEEEISKDLAEALQQATDSRQELDTYEKLSHMKLRNNRDKISSLVRQNTFASRSIVLNCFHLLEAYLNGLAWDYIQKNGTTSLSNRRKRLLEDATSVSIRDKLIKYPQAVTGRTLWNETDAEVDGFINTMKPFRDSLVHPSPFSAPAKFGGYDKLLTFYRVDYDTGIATITLVKNLIQRMHQHIYGSQTVMPDWLHELELRVQEVVGD